MRGWNWLIVAAILLIAVCAIAPWGAGREAVASGGLALAQPQGSNRQYDTGNAIIQAGNSLGSAGNGDPTGTPQPIPQWRGQGRHSAGAPLGSTPLSLTGSYYQ